ncbi:tRNA (uracil-5-)-methyltransferase homolog A-like [Parasteatoda tepidariorum]|nr:tRNA (uracil-5-)-methyltransferase homolog A-like [Parasteatoda tepidariorum]
MEVAIDTVVKLEKCDVSECQNTSSIGVKLEKCDVSESQSTSSVAENVDVKKEPDLYSYTKLNDFTSEIYKIEITNLPKYVGYGQLRKLLNSTLRVNPRKIKAIGNPPHFAFVTFK